MPRPPRGRWGWGERSRGQPVDVGELSEVRESYFVVPRRSFFGCKEQAEIGPTPINADRRLPTLRLLMPSDALVSVAPTSMAVLLVLAICAESKIVSAVVETITVLVVNEHTVGCIQNQAVQQDATTRSP